MAPWLLDRRWYSSSSYSATNATAPTNVTFTTDDWTSSVPLKNGHIRGIPHFFAKSRFGNTAEIRDAAQVLVVAALVSVVLRVFSRRRNNARIKWDDICAFLATFLLITNQMVFLLIDYLGVNSFSFYGLMNPHEENRRLTEIVIGLKLSLASEVLYLLSIFLVKFSMLFLYERFARQTKHIVLYLRVTQGLCIATFIACILSLFLTCIPVQMFWSLSGSSDQCSKRVAVTYTSGVSDIVSNTLVLAVPVPLLLRANLRKRQKVGLSILYFFGAFVIVASALRFATQLLNVSVPQSIGWSQMEISLAIILACAPMSTKVLLTPLVDIEKEKQRIINKRKTWSTATPDTPAVLRAILAEKDEVSREESREEEAAKNAKGKQKEEGWREDSLEEAAQRMAVELGRPGSYRKLQLVKNEEEGGRKPMWLVRPARKKEEV